jgi:hypothetical protein
MRFEQIATAGTPNVSEVPSPLCYDNRLYLVKNGRIVGCRDVQTGRLVYQQHLGREGVVQQDDSGRSDL